MLECPEGKGYQEDAREHKGREDELALDVNPALAPFAFSCHVRSCREDPPSGVFRASAPSFYAAPCSTTRWITVGMASLLVCRAIMPGVPASLLDALPCRQHRSKDARHRHADGGLTEGFRHAAGAECAFW